MRTWPVLRSRQHLFALTWLLLLALVALTVQWLPLSYEPTAPDLHYLAAQPLSGPATARHWLGTDSLGRDVLTNLLFGARTALLVSLPSAVLATLLGVMLGSGAGFWHNRRLRVPLPYWLTVPALGLALLAWPDLFLGTDSLQWLLGLITGLVLVAFGVRQLPLRWARIPLPLDRIVLWISSLLESIPRLVLLLAVATVWDTSVVGIINLLTLTCWTTTARLVRASVLRICALPYIEAARATGLPAARILACHVLPNTWPLIRATIPQTVAVIIAFETTLSFLGVGLPPEQPSWGRILATVRATPTAWWLVVPPVLCILCTMLALRQLAMNEEPRQDKKR